MKRKTVRFTVAIFLFAAFISLASCSFTPTVNQQCYTCIDFNKDGFCDKCSKVVEAPKPPHVECADADENGLCDECGNEMPQEEPPHAECSDEDENGFCDVCDKEIAPEEPPHTECTDADGNGFCDECDKALSVVEGLSLIKNGEIKFSLVTSNELSGNVHMRLDGLADSLAELGYTLNKYSDSEDNLTENVEVLIGTVFSRGEKYAVDGRDYGYKGYTVKTIDGKVIIAAGNEDSLLLAIEYFTENVLGITEEIEELTDASFLKEKEIESFHEYDITSVSIGGRDIRGYVIALDFEDAEALSVANEIRERIFRYSGYNLKLEDIENVSDKYISLIHREKSGGEGFYVNINSQNLEIISEYECATLEKATSYFSKLALAVGDYSFSEYTANTRDISYGEYGAVGDGEADDYEAIKKTHEHANRCGHRVVADDDAEYYIGIVDKTIYVKTDVKWGNATFIFDDREIVPGSSQSKVNIFHFLADNVPTATFTPDNCELIRELNANGGIDADKIKKLDLGLGYAAMLEVYNSNHKVYIRTHLVNEGNDQRELVIIDADGNIDPTTPFLLDYNEITSIVARSIETEPLTIDGGRFITRAPSLDKNAEPYMSRGIVIARANVTVKNLTHEIWDEGEFGCPYAGFLNLWRSANVTVEDCTFMSHKTYSLINSNGVFTNMGTYDIALQGSNNILFKNCTQSNFFELEGAIPYFAPERWGIMGSNYSKNIRYENCRLSRLDAHCGVYNASLKNCEVVYISVVGGGRLTVEDTTVYNDSIISLRGDYGSSWRGDVILKNVTLRNTNAPRVFEASWQNHYYGYKTYLPINVYIDNLEVYIGNSISFFTDSFSEKGEIDSEIYNGEENLNPMSPIEYIEITGGGDLEFIYPEGKYYENTEIIYK